jgi:heterotetrameric sarcosine oxidase gamma subunit
VPELIAKTALSGQAPLTLAGVTLAEATLGPITSIAAFPGQEAATANALGGWPAPNRFIDAPIRVWTAPDQVFLIGAAAPDLTGLAATTDQTGGWAALRLDGPQAQAALARIYPLDLRPAAFAPGHAARAPFGHMQSVLLCLAPDSFLILVFRSMARTAWAEVAHVLQAMAARAAAGV